MSMVKVVCLSFDKGMAEQRRIALKKAGFDVLAVTVAEQARAAVRRERADVIVIGHHFVDAETDAVIDEARKIWGASVVVVTGVGAEADGRADVSVSILHGVEGLVKAVETAVARLVAS
jgi:DNA-binding response OmpR family regulator